MNMNRTPAGVPTGGQFASNGHDGATAPLPSGRHDEIVAEMKSLVQEKYPDARGVSFTPHDDEIDHEWDDEYTDAWVDAGEVEREPEYHFPEDPEDVTEFDDEADAEMLSKLRELSKGLDRSRCGFVAIGDYQIEVYFD